MPRSRKRLRYKHRGTIPLRDPLAVDHMFDQVVRDAFEVALPRVLYHYTKWVGAEGVLSSRAFWATAHDCTNDEAELISADTISIEVAKELQKTAKGAADVVLDLFLKGYPKLQVTKLRTVYLACFSVARDDKEQWRKYSDDGRGVCLGIRMLDEPGPKMSDRSSALIRVDYSESSWRASLTENFTEICSLLEKTDMTKHNHALGLSALYRIGAFAAITAKQEKWAVEQEYRHVTIVHRNAKVKRKEGLSDGKTIRYLPIVVRADGKPIALSEIIIGPNQNADEARERLKKLLADAGYRLNAMEYPEITLSAVAPWAPASVPIVVPS